MYPRIHNYEEIDERSNIKNQKTEAKFHYFTPKKENNNTENIKSWMQDLSSLYLIESKKHFLLKIA